MSTRTRKPTDLPDPEESGRVEEEEPIEILEVVGVDETTGTVEERTKRRRSESATEPEVRDPRADSLAEQLEQAISEKEKYYDLLLRKQADLDNFRKRVERERGESAAVASRDVLKRLLPVLDNMERALRAAEGSSDPLYKGIELVHQQFLDLLKKEGVQPIDALGARFDPRLHEAVDVVDMAGFEEGVVLEEMQRGYMHNDKLLRPALVRVASGKGAEQGTEELRKPRGGGAGEES